MEEYGNNESYGVNWKQMRAVDGKQEIYLEWPKLMRRTFRSGYVRLINTYVIITIGERM